MHTARGQYAVSSALTGHEITVGPAATATAQHAVRRSALRVAAAVIAICGNQQRALAIVSITALTFPPGYNLIKIGLTNIVRTAILCSGTAAAPRARAAGRAHAFACISARARACFSALTVISMSAFALQRLTVFLDVLAIR